MTQAFRRFSGCPLHRGPLNQHIVLRTSSRAQWRERMSHFTLKSRLASGAASLVFAVALSAVLTPQTAFAENCLLDTNNDGDADSGVDTDGGASSGGVDARLACGVDAVASGASSTAVGSLTDATGGSSTALGNRAQAIGDRATAIGMSADATAANATALGHETQATGVNSLALGGGANSTAAARATGTNSIAIGGGDSTDLGALASGFQATAIGNASIAAGSSAVAVGVGAEAVGNASAAFGASATSFFREFR